MNADGSNDHTVVAAANKTEWADMPAWYGGGTFLLFIHDLSQFDPNGQWLGDTMTLDKVDLSSGARGTLAQNAQSPTTSAGGGLAWVSYTPGQLAYSLMYAPPDGSAARALVSDKDFQQIYRPRLSPDGQSVVFSGSGRSDGKGGILGLTAGVGSPLLGVAQAHGLPWDPWIIGIDGKNLRRLAAIGSDEQALTWSPDSQSVALAYYDRVFRLSAAGGTPAKVIPAGDAGGLDWK